MGSELDMGGLLIKPKDEFVVQIGMSLSSKKYSKAEIHYNLVSQEWGHGYTHEAAIAIAITLMLHRIEVGVAINNEASIKLLEKTGMIKEARHRKILPLREEWLNNCDYAILEEDWGFN